MSSKRKKNKKRLHFISFWAHFFKSRHIKHRGARRGVAEEARAPLNGNRLTNLLLTFLKTQNNSAHVYIAI